jgi:hypothetical protein
MLKPLTSLNKHVGCPKYLIIGKLGTSIITSQIQNNRSFFGIQGINVRMRL